jgi:hypothetical protein
MLFRASAAAALLAVASHVSAEEQQMPYKPIVKMSVHQMFGIGARQASGYQPTSTLCGTGDTCQDACGPTFNTCASTDGQTHCFDPAKNQECCTDGSGSESIHLHVLHVDLNCMSH